MTLTVSVSMLLGTLVVGMAVALGGAVLYVRHRRRSEARARQEEARREENRRLMERQRINSLFRSAAVEFMSSHTDYAEVEKYICEQLVAITGIQHLVLFPKKGWHVDYFGPGVLEHCRQCAYETRRRVMDFSMFGDEPEFLMPKGAVAAGLNRPEGCPVVASIFRQLRRADGSLWRAIADFTSRPDDDLKTVSLSMAIGLELIGMAYEREEMRAQKQQLKTFLAENARMLAARNEEIAAEKAKAAFFASVSHDIRTPLNAIIGFTELLRCGDVSPEETAHDLEMIETSGKMLLQLLNDLLDLSKLDTGRMKLQLSPTDGRKLVNDLLPVFSQLAAKGGQKIVGDVAEMPPVMVDAFRVRQVLFNLIGNAIKYAGPCTIKVSLVYEAEQRIRIVVSDDGKGVVPVPTAKLTDPYTQANVSDEELSSGLGLSICKELAEYMGGAFTLSTTIGGGCRFVVKIPARAATQDELEAERRAREAEVARAAQAVKSLPKRVLVVDDSAVNRKVITSMLKKLGVDEVVTTDNGVQALKALERNAAFDLVMADMWMPEMDGAELVKNIRADERFAKLFVCSVTADVTAKSTFREQQFDDILLKPITLAQLRDLFARMGRA